MEWTTIVVFSCIGAYYGMGVLFLCCSGYFKKPKHSHYIYLENVDG